MILGCTSQNIVMCAVLMLVSFICYAVFYSGSNKLTKSSTSGNTSKLRTRLQIIRGMLIEFCGGVAFWDFVSGGLSIIMIINQSDTAAMLFRFLAAGMIVRAGWLVRTFLNNVRHGRNPALLFTFGGSARGFTAFAVGLQLAAYSFKTQHLSLQQHLHAANTVLFWISIPLTIATAICGIVTYYKVHKATTISFMDTDRYFEGGSP